jgi:hypothetical protein
MIKVSIYLGKFSRLAVGSCATYYVDLDDSYGYGDGLIVLVLCGEFFFYWIGQENLPMY